MPYGKPCSIPEVIGAASIVFLLNQIVSFIHLSNTAATLPGIYVRNCCRDKMGFNNELLRKAESMPEDLSKLIPCSSHMPDFDSDIYCIGSTCFVLNLEKENY